MGILKKVWHYFEKQKFLLFVALLSSVFVAATDGAAAYILKFVLDDIFINQSKTMLMILPIGIAIIFLIRGVFRFFQLFLLRKIGLKAVQGMRTDLYEKMIRLPMAYYDNNATGDMMSRMVNDINQIKAAIPSMIAVIKDCFTVVFLIGVVFYQDFELGLYGLIAIPFMMFLIRKTSKKTKKYSAKGHAQMGSLASNLQESFSGIKVVKSFVMEKYESMKFAKENEKETTYQIKRARVASIGSPLMDVISGLALSAIIYFGGTKVISGESTPGTFFSFIAAFGLMFEPFKKINQENYVIQNSITAAERFYDILELPNDILENNGTEECNANNQEITFNNVCFTYKGTEEQVINNLNLTIKPGQTVALVGSSGAGKTTIASLIPRFYDVTDGSIKIGGTDLRDFDVYSLRRNIGIVSQEPFLFNDTIRNNIAYGIENATEEDIINAANSAYATDFINKLPNGFDTVIGERGDRLSGGQRQRITIARALLINPPILILDEATSSLDTESERIVQKALTNLMKGRTSVVIAHRLSTILSADMIVVMDKGRVESTGRHEELIGKSEIYTKLHQMQFNENRT
jgi:subfamily B ATP-binding cassette protein MsbA